MLRTLGVVFFNLKKVSSCVIEDTLISLSDLAELKLIFQWKITEILNKQWKMSAGNEKQKGLFFWMCPVEWKKNMEHNGNSITTNSEPVYIPPNSPREKLSLDLHFQKWEICVPIEGFVIRDEPCEGVRLNGLVSTASRFFKLMIFYLSKIISSLF